MEQETTITESQQRVIFLQAKIAMLTEHSLDHQVIIRKLDRYKQLARFTDHAKELTSEQRKELVQLDKITLDLRMKGMQEVIEQLEKDRQIYKHQLTTGDVN